jgi:tetratricopeptide (TPR) repeat protein
MNKSTDINERLIFLAREIDEFTSDGRYRECIKAMDSHAKDENSSSILWVLYLAKATCALRLDDVAGARKSVETIESATLSESDRIYVNHVWVEILQREGKLAEAKRLLSSMLANEELHKEEHREVYYEMLASMGIVSAHLKAFEAALPYLTGSQKGLEAGEWLDSTRIYEALCLQGLGRFSEAETVLKNVIEGGSGTMIVDAFYRWGALYLERQQFDLAVLMFQKAKSNLPYGRKSIAEILEAMSIAYRENGQIELADSTRRQIEAKPLVQ